MHNLEFLWSCIVLLHVLVKRHSSSEQCWTYALQCEVEEHAHTRTQSQKRRVSHSSSCVARWKRKCGQHVSKSIEFIALEYVPWVWRALQTPAKIQMNMVMPFFSPLIYLSLYPPVIFFRLSISTMTSKLHCMRWLTFLH